jgi:hypothetical protein
MSVTVADVLRGLADLAPAAAAGAGRTDIGVVTPFRAQADALEAALVAAFPVAEIERIGLRVGTVHAFQGSEADVVVCSLAVVDGDAAARVRFLGDSTLFNVMVSRARHRMVVLTSAANPAGLVRDYLEYGERARRPSSTARGRTIPGRRPSPRPSPTPAARSGAATGPAAGRSTSA